MNRDEAMNLLPARSPKLPRREYARLYTNGWRSSANNGSLESVKPDAWEDGYLDYASGRPKWHLRDCTAHHNDEGGCGLA